MVTTVTLEVEVKLHTEDEEEAKRLAQQAVEGNLDLGTHEKLLGVPHATEFLGVE